MTTILTETTIPAAKMGSDARKLRASLHMSRRQLAEAAGVTEQIVIRFEHDFPVTLDSKRRIFKELWAKKIGK